MRPRGPRFLYLLSEGLPPTVIESQVVTVLARLAERGLVFDLFVYQLQSPRSEWEVARRLSEIRGRLPGQVRLWPWPARTRRMRASSGSHPSEPAGVSRRGWGVRTRDAARAVILEFAHLALQILVLIEVAPAILRRDRVVVHARGNAVKLALGLKRWYSGFRVVADIRGDAAAEYLYHAESRGLSMDSKEVRRELASLRRLEARVVRRADSVQCVSQALRRRLEAEAGAQGDHIRVVPCLADETLFRYDAAQRASLRRDLGISDEPVLVYSGSLLAWQNGAAMLDLFRQLKGRLAPLHLLLLTPDRNAASALLQSSGLREGAGVTLRSVRHQEVPGYLSASDVGLLLRDPHPLNLVASPTKFAEYVLCGLPVLASRGIGDLDDLTEANRFGLTVGDYHDVAGVETVLRALLAIPRTAVERTQRGRRAMAILGLGSHVDGWTREYLAIAAGRGRPSG